MKRLVEFVAKKAGDDELGDVGSVRTPARGTHGWTPVDNLRFWVLFWVILAGETRRWGGFVCVFIAWFYIHTKWWKSMMRWTLVNGRCWRDHYSFLMQSLGVFYERVTHSDVDFRNIIVVVFVIEFIMAAIKLQVIPAFFFPW